MQSRPHPHPRIHGHTPHQRVVRLTGRRGYTNAGHIKNKHVVIVISIIFIRMLIVNVTIVIVSVTIVIVIVFIVTAIIFLIVIIICTIV